MTPKEMQDTIRECEFPAYTFTVQLDGRGEIYLQAAYDEPDTETGKVETQYTRRWFMSPAMTASEVAQTAFKCVITSMEHRTREWFKYKGQPVFSPHYDVEALVELCKSKRFVGR